MAITIEVPYFNSYVLKKISDVPYKDVANPASPAFSAWTAPPSADVEQDWYVEESRIRGGYNNTSTDYGVKAYIVEDNWEFDTPGEYRLIASKLAGADCGGSTNAGLFSVNFGDAVYGTGTGSSCYSP